MLQQMQLQKAIGELRSLIASYYDPMGTNADFKDKRQFIERMIEDLENHLG